VTERDGYEHGVRCWVDTWQEDPDTAATFYAGVFGWDVDKRTPPGTDTAVRHVPAARERAPGVQTPNTAPAGSATIAVRPSRLPKGSARRLPPAFTALAVTASASSTHT
jgi:hypothetical protein